MRERWDDLPGSWKKSSVEEVVVEIKEEPKVRDLAKEANEVGKRFVFGALCGAITGASFGFVSVMRDADALRGKNSLASKKILQFSAYFGAFFGVYQTARKLMSLNFAQQPVADNILYSAAATLLPMGAHRVTRPLIPYAVFLVVIDAVNELSENKK